MTTSVLITSYSSMAGEMEHISSMVGSEDDVSWNEHRSTDLTARLKSLDREILPCRCEYGYPNFP